MSKKYTIVIKSETGEIQSLDVGAYQKALATYNGWRTMRVPGRASVVWYKHGEMYRRFRIDETWNRATQGNRERIFKLGRGRYKYGEKTRVFSMQVPLSVFDTLAARCEADGVKMQDIAMTGLKMALGIQ